jgi:hypothetical protein
MRLSASIDPPRSIKIKTSRLKNVNKSEFLYDFLVLRMRKYGIASCDKSRRGRTLFKHAGIRVF